MYGYARTYTHTLPRTDFSSSCSSLVGTLKPIHVSLRPSLHPSRPPSLPFCSISCVSASIPHFCRLFLTLTLFPHSVFRVCYQIFHHVTVNKVKCSTAFFSQHLFFFLPPASVASQGFSFIPPVSCTQPCCNNTPFLQLFFFFTVLSQWNIQCDFYLFIYF